MQHRIEHNLPPERLRAAVAKFAQVYCERFKHYQASVQWLGDQELEVQFQVTGVRLSGRLHLGPDALTIDMDVPLAFRLFRGRAVRAIEEEVQPWLAAAARGDLDQGAP